MLRRVQHQICLDMSLSIEAGVDVVSFPVPCSFLSMIPRAYIPRRVLLLFLEASRNPSFSLAAIATGILYIYIYYIHHDGYQVNTTIT